ncbi:MAG: IS200/IS605 family transposase [Anaerohalosphaeraceae bacterium]|nr:IS200/IS605 family transposase [Anaerohalosphaeraceae bacterium]
MSYTNLNYHIVFSTKGRIPFLDEKIIERLSHYIAGIVKNSKAKLYAVNGLTDHMHLAVSLAPDRCLSDFMRILKTNSSRWIHETFPESKTFLWQDGYSAFTVSFSGLDKVIGYINNQHEHHKKLSFNEELIILLKKHNIEFGVEHI